MYNQSSEEFFNEKLEEDDFPADFFLQPDNSHIPSMPPQQDMSSNHFNLFLENEHFSMDLSAVKNLKSQIINSDLLIENNERLKKKVQELEFENKELKLMNVKNRDMEQQKVALLENKLKAAEAVNLQFKEQLTVLHAKENNPRIDTAMRDKIKNLEKTVKIREDELRRRDEEMRLKDSAIDELKHHLATREQELKTLQNQKMEARGYIQRTENEGNQLKKIVVGVKKRLRKLKCRFLRSDDTWRQGIRGTKVDTDDLKNELEAYKTEIAHIKESQEVALMEKLEKFKEELLMEFPRKVVGVLGDPEVKERIREIFPEKIKMEVEENGEEKIGVKGNYIEKMISEEKEKIGNEEINALEIIPNSTIIRLEEINNNISVKPESLKKLPQKKIKIEENNKPPEEKEKPAKLMMNTEKNNLDKIANIPPQVQEGTFENSFESDSKIRKVLKKPTSVSKEFEEILIQNPPEPKDLLKTIFPFYFKRKFLQSKSEELNTKQISSITSQISTIITSQNLLEILQEASPNYEPFEVSLSFDEFLSDLSQSVDEKNFIMLLEGVRDALKTPYVVQWKWYMKTRNQKYFNEDKKTSFIDFFKKTTSSVYFERLLNEFIEDPFENDFRFKVLTSLSPISFQLNNDLLDLITVNLLQGFQKKSQNHEGIRFLYDLMTQKFYIPRPETFLNLVYSIILLSPKTLQDPAMENTEMNKTYDISWILQIGSAQIWSAPYGPLTLQAIRLAIVDICNHWKILNRSSQNIYFHIEFQRKTWFILLRLYELLEKGQSSDVLFGLFNYESIRDSFQESLADKKRWQNNPMNKGNMMGKSGGNEDWPWFRGLNLDPLSLSQLLTNNLINILDKSLFYWDTLLLNNTVCLKGVLDLNDILATIGVYMGHSRFFMTGQLQKNLLGFIYNKKYDNTFQRTFSLLSLSLMSKNNGEKDVVDLLLAVLQERVPNIRVSQMDKVAALYCLWRRFNANIKELIEQNRAWLNPFILEMMNYLAFNKNLR